MLLLQLLTVFLAVYIIALPISDGIHALNYRFSLIKASNIWKALSETFFTVSMHAPFSFSKMTPFANKMFTKCIGSRKLRFHSKYFINVLSHSTISSKDGILSLRGINF
jgi:hypothetical protein